MSRLLSVADVKPATALYASNYLNRGASQDIVILLLALSITVLLNLTCFHLSAVDIWLVTFNIPGAGFVVFWI